MSIPPALTRAKLAVLYWTPGWVGRTGT
jgi:hypothetical protein